MRNNQLIDAIKQMPMAQRIVAASGLIVLAIAGFALYQWASTPSYSVLYTGLDDQTLAEVISGLEAQGVDYRLEAGGSQVLVPRASVYEARAQLAADGIRGGVSYDGYELLDEQGLSVSEFKQQIDYQRALEGELSRTLVAMDSISAATVHLVLPDEALFAENQEQTTASVVIDTIAAPRADEISTIAFVVSSAVEGLEVDGVTVAHVDGRVLHASGEANVAGTLGNRNLRTTEEFEASLAADVQALLASVVGPGHASVVVRAEMNFDEQTVESETYEPDSSVPIREQLLNETLDGAGAAPTGTVGVDGTELTPEADGSYTYVRDESTTEYGVTRTSSIAVTAPGQVEQLSVAVVVDDGSLTGADVPAPAEIESLVAAAIGLDAARGDTIHVTPTAFPADVVVDEPELTASAPSPLPQYLGAASVAIVVLALLFMTRTGVKKQKGGKRKKDEEAEVAQAAIGAAPQAGALPAPAATALPQAGATTTTSAGGASLEQSVLSLADEQPEQVAALMAEWLKEGVDA